MTFTHKDIVNIINSISGSYHPTVVFNDWVEMMALALSNQAQLNVRIWEEREKRYKELVIKHQKHIDAFTEMFAILTECFENGLDDYLGKIYMAIDAGNNRTGQFFTPFHIAEAVAKVALPDPDDDGYIRLNEPACGAGAMIIAAAKALEEKGINYQEKLIVVAQDLSVNSCYMCYVQLSLMGINATVIQGDTLAMQRPRHEQIYRTLDLRWWEQYGS